MLFTGLMAVTRAVAGIALTVGIGNMVDADMAAESARLQALQVQQQLGDGIVRTIALGSTDGLKRNLVAVNTGFTTTEARLATVSPSLTSAAGGGRGKLMATGAKRTSR